MKKAILIFVAALGFAFAANANNYSVNDSAIDALVESAIEAPATIALDVESFAGAAAPSATVKIEEQDIIATALCFFLGGLGIHRHYLGTSKFMWAAYLFTFGGLFGVVPFVDFVVLLVSMVDGSGCGQYCNDTSFLMWI